MATRERHLLSQYLFQRSGDGSWRSRFWQILHKQNLIRLALVVGIVLFYGFAILSVFFARCSTIFAIIAPCENKIREGWAREQGIVRVGSNAEEKERTALC